MVRVLSFVSFYKFKKKIVDQKIRKKIYSEALKYLNYILFLKKILFCILDYTFIKKYLDK